MRSLSRRAVALVLEVFARLAISARVSLPDWMILDVLPVIPPEPVNFGILDPSVSASAIWGLLTCADRYRWSEARLSGVIPTIRNHSREQQNTVTEPPLYQFSERRHGTADGPIMASGLRDPRKWSGSRSRIRPNIATRRWNAEAVQGTVRRASTESPGEPRERDGPRHSRRRVNRRTEPSPWYDRD